MPIYEYFCEGCKKEVTRTMSISEHDKASATCPSAAGDRSGRSSARSFPRRRAILKEGP